MKKVGDDVDTVVSAFDEIWSESIQYLSDRSGRSGKRLQIAAKILAIRETVTNVEANLKCAWWETFGKHSKKIRGSYQLFSDRLAGDGMMDVLSAVRQCVEKEKFDGAHKDYMQFVKEALNDI